MDNISKMQEYENDVYNNYNDYVQFRMAMDEYTKFTIKQIKEKERLKKQYEELCVEQDKLLQEYEELYELYKEIIEQR